MRLGPLASVSGLEAILAGQHSLNIARLSLILASIFLMVFGYSILTISFYREAPVFGILSMLFFIFFILFEISYRSVELFHIVLGLGGEYLHGSAETRARLLPHFQFFDRVVNAIYFPLLFSHLIASLCLAWAATKHHGGKLVVNAMGINSIRLVLRLSGFTPFGYLNIFSGVLYFPPVFVVFVLLMIWTWRRSNSSYPETRITVDFHRP